ncbi:hypothetical protein BC941DRAFT_412613 [Chlamydoabsidia padenii]|nr:hypothetical protein BC941DRAFT_412613 [Chlamydoabsidia padenii]
MTRYLPSLAILLFLLQLSMVHSLGNNRRKRNHILPTTALPLDKREDYSSFTTTEEHRWKYHISKASSKTTNQPSVTTVIIIQTNNQQTYHELGGGNGSSATTNGMGDPNNIEAQVNQDNAVLKRLITISTVVGGLGVVAIISGTIIYFRLRTKRRRQMKTLRYDTNNNNNSTGHRRHDSTSVSVTTHHSQRHDSIGQQDVETIEMPMILPSAPPEPVLLPPRERHQQSMLMQQHHSVLPSSPAPSAPSAKELELNLPSSSSTHFSPSSSSTVDPISIHVSPPSPPVNQNSTLSIHPKKPSAGSDDANSSSGSTTIDQARLHPPLDIPPPAYTPSAPPLFILPPSQRRRSADQLSLDRYRQYLA